jgi:hypothetical protein
MAMHKVTEFYAEQFGVCPYIILKFHTISMIKSFIKENND